MNAGDRLGPYEILTLIGKGGMGEVYRARDPRLNREVAVKVLHGGKLQDPSRRERFLREARAASALNHPSIVTIHDLGTEGDRVYMVMELIDGQPLDTLIPPAGLPIGDVIRIASQIAGACARAHAAGIVHRDLKPANVMVTTDGRVKLLDFGLVKLVDSTPFLENDPTVTAAANTIEGAVLGTPAYMSPEQAEGQPLDARSDIFSFGAVLYELCAGRRAFRGNSRMSVIASVLRQDPEPVTKLRPDAGQELARLIERCMVKDPRGRIQTMTEVREALDRMGQVPAHAPNAAAGSAAKHAPRWIAAAALAIAALAGIAFHKWRDASNAPSPDLQPVPFTAFPGSEIDPEFSPGGDQAAFAWNGEDRSNWDIYAKLIGPGVPLRLTTSPLMDWRPRWSPDGRAIAFLRLIRRDLVAVVLVPALGGAERTLGEFYSKRDLGGPLASLAWTQGSRHLVLSASPAEGEPNALILLTVDSGATRVLSRLSSQAEGYTSVDVSPDGTMLAAAADLGTRKIHVWSLTADKNLTNKRVLETGPARVGHLRWTADSRGFVFDIFLSAPIPLYRASLDGGAPRPLSWSAPGVLGAAISAKSNRLIFVRSVRDTNMWELDLKRPLGAAQPRLVAPSSGREVSPDYSWDGQRLAYYSNQGGSVQIWTCDADGTKPAELTALNPQATTGTPRWSPDGKRIAFDSDASGSYQIYVISSTGGQARALTGGDSGNYIASWTPDGKSIYFTSNRTGRNEIWRISPDGGEPEQVTRVGATGARISRDGQWMYFTKEQENNSLWRMPLGGGPEEKVTESVFRYNYALGAKGVYWIPGARPDGTSSVRYLEFGARTSRELLRMSKAADLGLAVSPDESKLLFAQRDYAGEDLMLVENFR